VDNRTITGTCDADGTTAVDAAQLGQTLTAARAKSGVRLGRLAKTSDGRFTKESLQAFERGQRPVDLATATELAQLYGCDLRAALPQRTPVEIEHDRLSAGGMVATYDPADHTTVLPAYVRLVRMLRRATPDEELELRRPDVQVVGSYWAECMMEQVHDRVMATVPEHV
jgi:transcriptional regulator with XRE-family HTH domain